MEPELQVPQGSSLLECNPRTLSTRQKACVVWFTGLSGAGKSTLAEALERSLQAAGLHTYLLDGDRLRLGLNRDLGFSEQDRQENIRRAGEVAALMAEAGLIVLAAFISPFRADRDAVRQLLPGRFVEVFIDTPLHVCEARDPKGLYRRARAGLIQNFTGLDSPFESPQAAELRFDTSSCSVEETVQQIHDYLRSHHAL